MEMDVLYGHQLTLKWRCTGQLECSTGLPYDLRGWPFFETEVSRLITLSTNVLDLGRLELSKPRVLNLATQMNAADMREREVVFEGKLRSFDELAAQGTMAPGRPELYGMTNLLKDERHPPMAPEYFAQIVRKKRFTNAADVESVIQLHGRVAAAVFAGTDEFVFEDLGWGEEQMKLLVGVFPLCKPPKELILSSNPLGDAGTRVLSDYASGGGLKQLTSLGFEKTGMTPAGMEIFMQGLIRGDMPVLEQVRRPADRSPLLLLVRCLPHTITMCSS